MELNTERLKIIPLEIDNFKLLIYNKPKLEKILGLNITNTYTEEPVKSAMKKSYKKALINRDDYMWYTNWIVVLKKENRIIGGILIKGAANQNYEVEIGYGIDDDYQGKGYITETVKELTKWILSNENVKYVIATTLKENKASHRVLEKNNFSNYKKSDKYFYWRLGK